MAEGHDKFVLKERQKLEARAKKLEKQEAEFAAVREQNTALEAEVRAKGTRMGELQAEVHAAQAKVMSSEERTRELEAEGAATSAAAAAVEEELANKAYDPSRGPHKALTQAHTHGSHTRL
jgi:chromosome segregation ATPase